MVPERKQILNFAKAERSMVKVMCGVQFKDKMS